MQRLNTYTPNATILAQIAKLKKIHEHASLLKRNAVKSFLENLDEVKTILDSLNKENIEQNYIDLVQKPFFTFIDKNKYFNDSEINKIYDVILEELKILFALSPKVITDQLLDKLKATGKKSFLSFSIKNDNQYKIEINDIIEKRKQAKEATKLFDIRFLIITIKEIFINVSIGKITSIKKAIHEKEILYSNLNQQLSNLLPPGKQIMINGLPIKTEPDTTQTLQYLNTKTRLENQLMMVDDEIQFLKTKLNSNEFMRVDQLTNWLTDIENNLDTELWANLNQIDQKKFAEIEEYCSQTATHINTLLPMLANEIKLDLNIQKDFMKSSKNEINSEQSLQPDELEDDFVLIKDDELQIAESAAKKIFGVFPKKNSRNETNEEKKQQDFEFKTADKKIQ